MPTVYSENPSNWDAIAPYVKVNINDFIDQLFMNKTCYFYDTCSFRYHANMYADTSKKILAYIKNHNGFIIITRSVLMELTSLSGIIHSTYVQYLKTINQYGLNIYVIYEEDFFDVMAICFSTNTKINELLMWSVRMMKHPTSTIETTLNEDDMLTHIILRGKNPDNKRLFKHFFSAVRNNKESGDNLGEELLGICLHMLSQLPGEEDGKFCLITDDKGAVGKIDQLFKQTPVSFRGKRIIMFSTPKLAQTLYEENYITDKKCLLNFLTVCSGDKIKVLGTQIYDLKSTIISLSKEELANQIITNSIHITF